MVKQRRGPLKRRPINNFDKCVRCVHWAHGPMKGRGEWLKGFCDKRKCPTFSDSTCDSYKLYSCGTIPYQDD